jgi:O-antigen/teichoic acid export membrane protein
LIFNYLGFLQFGVTDALMLQLPSEYVKKNYYQMKLNADISMSFVLFNHLLIGILFAIIALIISMDYFLIITVSVYLIASALYQVYLHHVIINRFMYNFRAVAIVRYINAFTRGFFQSLAVYFYGLYGFLLIEGILYIIPILVIRHYGQEKLNISFDKVLLKKLLSMGLPLIVIAIIGVFVGTVDRWFATASGSLEGMASYSVIGFLGTLLLFVPNQTLSIFSQYSREFITKNKNYNNLFGYYISYSTLFILIFSAIGVIVLNLTYNIVSLYIPQYNDILSLLPVIIIISILKISNSSISNYCIITKNTKMVLKTNLLGLSIIIGINFLLLYLDLSTLKNIIMVSMFTIILQLFYLLKQIKNNYLKSFNKSIYIWLLLIFISIINIQVEYSLQSLQFVLLNAHLWSFYSFCICSSIIIWLYKRNYFSGLITIAQRKF